MVGIEKRMSEKEKIVVVSRAAYDLIKLSADELARIEQTHIHLLRDVIIHNELLKIFKCLPYAKQLLLYRIAHGRISKETRTDIENIIRSRRGNNDLPASPVIRREELMAEEIKKSLSGERFKGYTINAQRCRSC